MTKQSAIKKKRKSKTLFKKQLESMYMDLHKNANGMSAKKLEFIHYVLVKDLGVRKVVDMTVDVEGKALGLKFNEEVIVEEGFFKGLLAYMDLADWTIGVE